MNKQGRWRNHGWDDQWVERKIKDRWELLRGKGGRRERLREKIEDKNWWERLRNIKNDQKREMWMINMNDWESRCGNASNMKTRWHQNSNDEIGSLFCFFFLIFDLKKIVDPKRIKKQIIYATLMRHTGK